MSFAILMRIPSVVSPFMMVDNVMRIPRIVSPLPVDFGHSARALSVPGGAAPRLVCASTMQPSLVDFGDSAGYFQCRAGATTTED